MIFSTPARSLFSHPVDVLQKGFTVFLTPLQKKTALLAIAALALLSIVAYYVRHYRFQAPASCDLEQAAGEPIVIRNPGVAGKLDKNRNFAKNQQDWEKPKYFRLKEDDPPEYLNVFVPYMGWMEKPLMGRSITMSRRQVGMACCEGARESMEDAEIAVEGEILIGGQEVPIELFGVFDGHGGAKASAFVRERIFDYVNLALARNCSYEMTDEEIFQALIDAFRQLDADYEDSYEGTTATVALIIQGKIWVANAGDSRTILVKKGQGTQASEDAKPTIRRYKRKIEKLGGKVISKRVNGCLAVASAIGDKLLIGDGGRCCVPPDPKITNYPIDEFLEGYLVLACDGLYDVATTNEVSLAIHLMELQGKSEEMMAKSLVYHAIVQGNSKDNVTVMVIRLDFS